MRGRNGKELFDTMAGRIRRELGVIRAIPGSSGVFRLLLAWEGEIVAA
jgi:hypothetical protein